MVELYGILGKEILLAIALGGDFRHLHPQLPQRLLPIPHLPQQLLCDAVQIGGGIRSAMELGLVHRVLKLTGPGANRHTGRRFSVPPQPHPHRLAQRQQHLIGLVIFRDVKRHSGGIAVPFVVLRLRPQGVITPPVGIVP